MNIKKVGAKAVRDSRGEKTILVYVKTSKGKFSTISPSGKSTGKYEVKPYLRSLPNEIKYIGKLSVEKLSIDSFEDLKKVEKYVRLGGNSLFALSASLLKALAREEDKELFELLGGKKVRLGSVGNSVGGGLHSKGVKGKIPEIQEFHFIVYERNFRDSVRVGKEAYKMIGRLLGARRRNDEGAWETGYTNEEILDYMKVVQKIMRKRGEKIEIGLDVAANSFFDGKNYRYKNPGTILDRTEQVDYVSGLIKEYGIKYVEDGVEESDFRGFSEILRKSRGNECLVVGDDLTTTNPTRLKRAIRSRSINAIIVKPNQIGSLLKVKEVIEICRKHNIKTIVSHRSGESKDDTIADLGVGFNCDYIKTGVYGKERVAKLNRLIKIEKKLRK